MRQHRNTSKPQLNALLGRNDRKRNRKRKWGPRKHPPQQRAQRKCSRIHLLRDLGLLLLDTLHESKGLPLGPLLNLRRQLGNPEAECVLVEVLKVLREER